MADSSVKKECVMKQIVLVTSIAPKDIENQKSALNSWIEAGFRIVSCNIRDEIEVIEKEFPQIEFVEMKRDGRGIIGKPCPYIYDMLQVAEEKAEDICGIVNSDIHLCKFNEKMYTYIREQAAKYILFMRRNEVNSLKDINSFQCDMFFGGIDVFIFHKEAVKVIDDDGLLLGQAMWDYWLPLMFERNNMKMREFMNPIVFHVKHAVRWKDDITTDISWKICRKYFPEVKKENAVFVLKDKFFLLISSEDMGICWVSDKTAKKKVAISCKAEIKPKIVEAVALQTHKHIVVADSKEDIVDYDYIFSLPYVPILCHVFVDTILWIMENYNFRIMNVLTYIRGNRTNALHIGNCCNIAIKRFNRELETIKVLQKRYDFKKNDQVTLCTTYVCSVQIEENEKTIWKRDGFCGKILIYPAGYMARVWARRYKDISDQMQIVGFVDGSTSVQNTLIEGLPVYSPDKILEQKEYDRIVIVSNIYQEEIYDMLREKVPENKLIIWNEFNLKNMI